LFASKQHADERRLDEIERALTPPVTAKTVDRRPAWFGSDEDVWAEWKKQTGGSPAAR